MRQSRKAKFAEIEGLQVAEIRRAPPRSASTPLDHFYLFRIKDHLHFLEFNDCAAHHQPTRDELRRRLSDPVRRQISAVIERPTDRFASQAEFAWDDASQETWARAYAHLAQRLPSLAQRAALALCGLHTCVDSVISLGEASALFHPTVPPGAKALADELVSRAAQGIGGEIRVDWPEGPAWLARSLKFRSALGGTGAHAARILTLCGVKALLTIADRSPRQLSQIDDDILVAVHGQPVRAAEARRNGTGRPDIFVFEYTTGQPIASVTPKRSSRIIVRFTDHGLDRDADFVAASAKLASQAGSAILSGFSTVSEDRLQDALDWARALARIWRDGAVPLVHFELAGYQTSRARDAVIDALKGLYNSIGMSHSEFAALASNASLADGMIAIGDRLRVRRVCVHADHWAASATMDDPSTELDALMTGCLLSSVRAAAGRPMVPESVPAGVSFFKPPFAAPIERGPWSLVSCSAPYLRSPATTLGLGDTFMAGCLLVLGTREPANGEKSSRQIAPGRDD